MKKYLLFILLASAYITTNGQAGSLDRSFGNNGITRTDFGGADGNEKEFNRMLINANESIYIITTVDHKETVITRRDINFQLNTDYGIGGHSMPLPISNATAILQPDGKLLIGSGSMVNGSFDFTLYRFKPDGQLDETFSGDGKQTTDIAGLHDVITTLALQNDGKIIAAGRSSIDNGTAGTLAVARYNADGSPDDSFGNGGRLNTTFSQRISRALAIGIRDDGTITVACPSDAAQQVHDLLIARFITNGQPDLTFANGGKAVIPLSAYVGSPLFINCITIQQDGKILVGGSTWHRELGLVLARLHADATFDQQFSNDGIELTDFGGAETIANAIALQADGKIIVAGGRYSDFFISRYYNNGVLDSSFSEDGFDNRNITNGLQPEMGRAVAVFNDGKILMAGQALNAMGVLKYDINGNLDKSFDQDGVLIDTIHGVHGGQAYLYASAIQADGKIVVGGSVSTLSPGGEYRLNMLVGRFHPDGKIDSSFSGDGKQVFNATLQARDVIIQPDGKIIVAGSTSLESSDFAIARLHPNGDFDNSFSGDGKLIIDFGYSDGANEVCLQPDGKIIVAGFSGLDFAIARCNSDGTLDNSFSGDGKLVIDLGFTNERAFAVMVQPDGKIVLAGEGYGRFEDFALLRFNVDGTTDPSFGVNGKVITDLYGGSDYASSAILQPDGKILVAGALYPGIDSLGTDFAVVRYNSNGSLDTGFSNDGKLRFNVQSISEGITSLAMQADQKILLAGFTEGRYKYHLMTARNNPGDFAIARLNTNGTLDESFASGGIMIHDISGTEDGIESISIWKHRIYAVGRTSYVGDVGIIAAYRTGDSNKAPIAGAWFQKYYTPTSALLAAWGSRDPEGGPITYFWEKAGGPAGSTLLYANSASPVVNGLVTGTYTFLLTVTDNQGATGLSTLTFTVNNNLPPVAGAWLQKYYSPTSVLLAAWGSYDPEGAPIKYFWEKMAGADGSTLLYGNSASPVINGLTNGVYTYRLTVTDNHGATGTKELTFTVNTLPLSSNIAGQSLPEVTANNSGQFIIYPNPVSELLIFKWNSDYIGDALLSVIDIAGRKVQRLRIRKSAAGFFGNMEVSGLKPGQYYLYLTNGKEKILSMAFMKQ